MSSRLFVYNPTCELAIANGQVSYMPPRNLATFERDLAVFPYLFAGSQDFVLVPPGAQDYPEAPAAAGWEMPAFISAPESLPEGFNDGLEFHPWGWSPAVYRRFKPFLDYAHAGWDEGPFYEWSNELALLLSRDTGYRLLREVRAIYRRDRKSYPELWLPDDPLVIKNPAELSRVISLVGLPAVIKTPWSASGRGLYRVRHPGDDPQQSPWVRGMLRRQGKLFAEPWLDKVQDVSFQFWLWKDKVQYLGHNFFYTDASGQFQGCAVGPPQSSAPEIMDGHWLNEVLAQAAALLSAGLEAMNLNKEYTGPVGVDGLFFRKKEGGEVWLNPCLEMNLRYNMGLANVMMRSKIDYGSSGIWKTERFPEHGWRDFCRVQTRLYPPVSEGGRLISGFWPLVSPYVNKEFGAWLWLESSYRG